jgi:N-acetylglucosamine kinase-like BadF-type ATPase
MNAAGIAPDGRTARLAALGGISGDWGGGGDVGLAALGAAVRARDGRGPRTALETLVPGHFGYHRPIDLTRALELGTVPESRLRELSPIVFGAAGEGDAVARSIVDRLADELVAMAGAMIRRLNLTRSDPDVVMAGGVFNARDNGFEGRIAAGVHAVAPKATLRRSDAPPVLGAALLALDRVVVSDAAAHDVAEARLRGDLRRWEPPGG